MEIVKTSIQFTREDILSSTFFILFGIAFVIASIGFWQFGKTDVAKAFTYPALVAGLFLLMIGAGLLFSNKARLSKFEGDYQKDPTAFVQSEIARAEKTISEYQNIALKVFPMVIVVAALLIVFIDKPVWRAIGISTIAMMLCVVWVDSLAKARMEAYRELLFEERREAQ